MFRTRVSNRKFLLLFSGYIVAELRNNGMSVAAEYQKAMRLCDNSGKLSALCLKFPEEILSGLAI